MEIVKPRSQVLTIWRILLVILSFVPTFAIALFLSGWLYWLATIVWLLLFLGAFLIYLPMMYNSLIYIIDDEAITMRYGVVYHNIYTLPLKNVQFTELVISPFSRLFGLVTLKVVSPGASITMPGLSIKEARAFAHEIALKREES